MLYISAEANSLHPFQASIFFLRKSHGTYEPHLDFAHPHVPPWILCCLYCGDCLILGYEG